MASQPSSNNLTGKQQPHVLVFPWPAQGHINPMMHLSKKLAARGVIITFVNTQVNHDRLIQLQTEAQIPLLQKEEEGLDIRLVGIPDGRTAEDYTFRHDVAVQCGALKKMGPLLVDLVEKLVPPVSCIIADLLVMSTAAVAKRFEIPHVGFWTQNAASYAAYAILTAGYRPPKENPVRDGEVQNLITCIPGCPPLRLKDVPTSAQTCDPSDFMFGCLTEIFQQVQQFPLVLLNTCDDLEPVTLQYLVKPNIRSIGPVLPSDFFSSNHFKQTIGTSLWPEDDGSMKWLDERKPDSVLYVSFGSVAVLSEQQIAEFAAGLEASQYPILMVLRPAMMLGKAAVFPEGFVDRMKDKARFVGWAPQLEVLSHRAIGGFLTHCGWNSTLEGISRGQPMLCWPYFSDQMLDCRCIVDGWKIGLDFEDDRNGLVSRVEIEKKVRLLMEGELRREMKGRVSELKTAVLKAVMEGGSSHSNFEAVLSFISS